MTRKHFKGIAAAIASGALLSNLSNDEAACIVNKVASYLATTNNRFNRGKFYRYCMTLFKEGRD